MLIEQQQRSPRVRFKHPIRVVTLDGPPRVIRTLTANVSKRGLFVRMPEPLPRGSRVALSLEAGGRAFAFAQGEVAWGRVQESQLPGRFPGCGVRFTDFLHPRSKDLVEYLVANLDTGKPLVIPAPGRAKRWWVVGGAVAGALGLSALGVGGWLLLAPAVAELDAELETDSVPLVVVAPSPLALAPAPTTSAVELPELDLTAEQRDAPGDSVSAIAASAAPPATEAVQAPAAVGEPAPAAANVAPAMPESAPQPADEARVAAAPAPAPEGEGASAAPVAAPVKDAPLAAPVASARSAFVPTTKGAVRLPTGGAAKLAWSSDGRTVRLVPTLAPGAKLARVFVLAGPSRAVFDLEGVAPRKSHQLEADAPHVSGVRVGKLGRGTRVVVDLQDVPVSHVAADGSLTLEF